MAYDFGFDPTNDENAKAEIRLQKAERLLAENKHEEADEILTELINLGYAPAIDQLGLYYYY